jgi:hypothetical protein
MIYKGKIKDKLFRKRNRFFEILLEHIKQNHREYIISIIVLLIGVIVRSNTC